MQRLAGVYQENGLQGVVVEANRHRLVALLLAGARTRVESARAALERADGERKRSAISKACAIVHGLRAGIDHGAGGEIAKGLDALYEYVGRRLIEANQRDDRHGLDEADGLLASIESAWNAIDANAAGVAA